MDILVVGNGGREHAICAALKKSDKCGKLYCAKGNAGIGEIATLVDIDPCDIEGICDFVDKNQNIALTVVAPDDPLALGLVDELQKRGHRAFGPNKAAAIIEASKAFSKDMMKNTVYPPQNTKRLTALKVRFVMQKNKNIRLWSRRTA